MEWKIKQVDRVEILTLQDNIIDLVSRDDTEILKRARPLRRSGKMNSILAEHGFSTLVTVSLGESSRSILFDFGFSEHGAASNADVLEVDLARVEAFALSHGHLDHVGGLGQLAKRVNKKGLEFVVHPAAFRSPRYRKISEDRKIKFPPFTREMVHATGSTLIETKEPYPLLDNSILFLGEIPRLTDFEKGDSNRFYEEDGKEKRDLVEEDTAIVIHVRDKGLVVLSGCAHSGIINTVNHAIALTGVKKIFTVMGGFHLPIPTFEPIIEPTTNALRDLNPDYIVPCHCTGRKAIMHIESEMPERFLLNMAGTRLIFGP